MIDAYETRQAALDKHLPAAVLVLLAVILIIAEIVRSKVDTALRRVNTGRTGQPG